VPIESAHVPPDVSSAVPKRRFVAGLSELEFFGRPTLVAIGNFDGVHRGHRAVLAHAAESAKARGLLPVVLTFHPHPAQVLRGLSVEILTPLDRKLDLIEAVSEDLVTVVEPFTLELASLAPEAFVRDLLCDRLKAEHVLVGSNFRFGKGRAGDVARLSELGRAYGFEVETESILESDGVGISSTRTREHVHRGEVRQAAGLLGRPHALTGTVVHGAGRGSGIGVPTANLDGIVELIPAYGVYAVLVDRVDANGVATRLAAGVVNVGDRPTVRGGFSVEAHLFDLNEDLYGATLRVHLLERLRAERRFESLEELREQIARDVDAARKVSENPEPLPRSGGAWY
jgi:riboflavin kinase/FMN adenylyltransferase